MIVFDGDSTLVFEDFGVPVEESWPFLVAQDRNMQYANLAKQQSTAAKCRTRLWKALELNPSWYVLQVGQWSSSNEPIEDFERNVRAIIEDVRIFGAAISLVTPPKSCNGLWNTEQYASTLERLGTVYSVHVFPTHKHTEIDWFISDSSICHLNASGSRKMFELFKAHP